MTAARPDLYLVAAFLRSGLSSHKRRSCQEHYSQKRSHRVVPLSLNESTEFDRSPYKKRSRGYNKKGTDDIFGDLCGSPQRSLRFRLFLPLRSLRNHAETAEKNGERTCRLSRNLY
jgi:hypothetical protein